MPAAALATALATMILTGAGVAGAVDADGLAQVPPPIDGDVVYVPWTATNDLGITIDGSLDDWAGVPTTTTTGGPTPSADPATTGELTWSVIAAGSELYVSATITDASIVAGLHEENYWNEDSIEVYLNATDAIDTASYAPGIAQVRFSAVDIGNIDPTALTLSGTNADTFDVEGLVFATPDGWGVEAVIDFSAWVEPAHGLSLGFQVHANGATTADRDLKLIWSKADVEDLSFDNPSVFGTAVFFELGQSDAPTPVVRNRPAATAPTATAPTTLPTETSTTTASTATTVTEPGTATEDTALLDDTSAGTDTTAPDDADEKWTQSPLLWIVPLAIGLASLIGFALSRTGASPDDEVFDDEVFDDPDREFDDPDRGYRDGI